MKAMRTMIFCLLAMFALPCAGQTIDELREQIRRAEQEIKASTELLNCIQKDQSNSQAELKLVQSRIRSRQELVSKLEQQLDLITEDIEAKSGSVQELESEVDRLKAEYAAMVRDAFRNYKLNTFMTFLFASKDFNEATRRIAFMRRYNDGRRKKVMEISARTDSLSRALAQLDSVRTELEGTRTAHRDELTTLGRDESQFRSRVSNLQKKRAKIEKDVKAQKAIREKAQKRIEEMIAEEARKNRAEVRTEAQEKYITELSGRFDQNMGKLPYPVRNGVIVDRYGVHNHTVAKNVTTNNKGINIAAARGAEVTCVFEGKVTLIFALAGYHNCVMVRHGNYLTLYANLATVSVKTGDNVALNQRLGRLPDTPNSEDHILHFEVWKEQTNLNPENWLRR